MTRPVTRLVIIESPFRARTATIAKRNVRYMLAAMRHSIWKGEAPLLSHFLYTGVLNDDIPKERRMGIELGYAWWPVVEAICFYCDLGWTEGMVDAKLRATQHRIPMEER